MSSGQRKKGDANPFTFLEFWRGDIGDWHSVIFDQASDHLRFDLRQPAAPAPVSQFHN
jgi:hypothetical protein